MPERCPECLYWPAVVRTAEHVATLLPPRAYWATCAVCGTTVDLAAAVRARVLNPHRQGRHLPGHRTARDDAPRRRTT
jgi:hypothetical protein